MDNLDLRSLAPTFERKITWTDGTEYSIREIEDLTEAEFLGMLTDERDVANMSIVDQREMHKRHLQMMVIVPIELSPAAGIDRAAELEQGDVVYAVTVGNFERVSVEKVDGSPRFVPPLTVAAGTRSFRAIRKSEIDNLTERQFSGALRFVKTPPKKDGDTGGEDRPPVAAI